MSTAKPLHSLPQQPSEILRPRSYCHESVGARIIYVDDQGDPTGELGEPETFLLVDGLWYPTRSIKSGAVGYRRDQLVLPMEGLSMPSSKLNSTEA